MTKTLTLTNYEIVEILNKLYSPDGLIQSTDPDKKLPVPVLWKINGNIRKLKEIQDRISEEEQKINEAYFNDDKSETNEEGLQQVKPEFREAFINEKKELMNIENEVELSMIKLSDIEALSFVPSDFMLIEFMITDESEE